MLNVNSVAVVVLVVILIAYFVGCIATYVHLFASKTKPFDHDKVSRVTRSPLKIFVVVFSLISLYLLGRWTVQQIVFGCTNLAFWNMTCYDLNQLNKVWLGIIAIIGTNALLISYLYDTKWNSRSNDNEVKTKLPNGQHVLIRNDSHREER